MKKSACSYFFHYRMFSRPELSRQKKNKIFYLFTCINSFNHFPCHLIFLLSWTSSLYKFHFFLFIHFLLSYGRYFKFQLICFHSNGDCVSSTYTCIQLSFNHLSILFSFLAWIDTNIFVYSQVLQEFICPRGWWRKKT